MFHLNKTAPVLDPEDGSGTRAPAWFEEGGREGALAISGRGYGGHSVRMPRDVDEPDVSEWELPGLSALEVLVDYPLMIEGGNACPVHGLGHFRGIAVEADPEHQPVTSTPVEHIPDGAGSLQNLDVFDIDDGNRELSPTQIDSDHLVMAGVRTDDASNLNDGSILEMDCTGAPLHPAAAQVASNRSDHWGAPPWLACSFG